MSSSRTKRERSAAEQQGQQPEQPGAAPEVGAGATGVAGPANCGSVSKTPHTRTGRQRRCPDLAGTGPGAK